MEITTEKEIIRYRTNIRHCSEKAIVFFWGLKTDQYDSTHGFFLPTDIGFQR